MATDKPPSQKIKEILAEACDQRGRYYKNFYSFGFRFEADDTSAVSDFRHFSDIMRALKFPKPRELVLEAKSKSPGWDLSDMIRSIANEVDKADGRSLIIGHYAGHGELDIDGELCFSATRDSPRKIRYDRELTMFRDVEQWLNTDVVLILDSCYSCTALRGWDATSRSVEVVCAVGASQKAFGSSRQDKKHTFTSRLADLVAQHAGNPDISSICFGELVEDIRAQSNPERMPEYSLEIGSTAIRIPIRKSQPTIPPHLRHQQSSSSLGSGVRTIQPTLYMRAIFTVHLNSEIPNSAEIRQLLEWIQTLDTSIGLDLTGVYHTESTTLMFEAPFGLWQRLKGIRNFARVCETQGGNLLQDMIRTASVLH
ncbi:hypothetical protein MMC11_000033 [Xylographa trunciseda]|nr:hypothetical protein [Xylographa trunciseda]